MCENEKYAGSRVVITHNQIIYMYMRYSTV